MSFTQSENLGLFALGGWVEQQKVINIQKEDAALRRLAAEYSIELTEPDWVRTLALFLAIEHSKGFYKSLGSGYVPVVGGLLDGRARPNYPGRAGRPTKKYHQEARENAAASAALTIRERSPGVSLLRACGILHNRAFILPGDKKPLSKKMLYTFAIRGTARYRAALAKALRDGSSPSAYTGILGPT